MKVKVHVSLTSALDGGEWTASPGRFTPGEIAPGTHSVWGWAGPVAGLDARYKTWKYFWFDAYNIFTWPNQMCLRL
jgi:hypothetical protein